MSFLNKYFITPILFDEGYNIFNTLAYAVLAIIILYGTYKLMEKLKVKIGIKMFLAIIPFIAFGSINRAFVDHEFFILNKVNSFFLISPGIWLVSIFFFFLAFIIGHYAQKNTNCQFGK